MMFVLIFFAVGVVGVLTGLAFANLRRDSAAPWVESQRPTELERRLARLEQAAEESGRAMERLEEGQRFLLTALTERGDAHPSTARRALAPGEHPAASPHDAEPQDPTIPHVPPNERRS